jgi:uncharacterized protein (TIGR02145 family)
MKAKVYILVLTVMSAIGVQAQTVMNIHLNNGSLLEIPLNTVDSITYTIPNPGNLASIATTTVSTIAATKAVSGGNITNDGGSIITQRGVCYSTSSVPTTADSIIISGSGAGSFICILTGLTANTTYFVRAYAINSAGTDYGNQVSFTTTAGGEITTPGAGVTFDGYTYSSIILGNGQEWFSENLRTSIFSNGDIIPNITDDITWLQTTTAAWSVLDANYEAVYGKSYNGYTVVDPRNVCPSGWHAPSFQDFQLLTDYLGGAAIAGDLMKSEVWTGNPNTNLSGFSALPAGLRVECGINTTCFAQTGNCTIFHLTQFSSANINEKYSMCVSNATNAYFGDGAIIGGSIRCVKD